MASDTGTLTDITFRSRTLVKDMRLHAYLPPGYSPAHAPYPVVYLLHEWGFSERFWTAHLNFDQQADRLINSGAVAPFVAVMPQGDKSYFINAENPHGNFDALVRLDEEYFAGALEGFGQYGDYVVQDVLSTAQKQLNIRADAAGRVVAGTAMGASGAAALAFSLPEEFCAVGIHSPALFGEFNPGPPWIFGFGDTDALSRRDPVQLAGRVSAQDDLRIYIDCGLDDDDVDRVADLHYALEQNGAAHHYRCRPGQRDAAYWRQHVGEYIGFYAAGW